MRQKIIAGLVGLTWALGGCDDGGGAGDPVVDAQPMDAVIVDAQVDQAVPDAEVDAAEIDDAAVDQAMVAGTLEIDPVAVVLRVGEAVPTQQFTLRRTFPDADPVAVPEAEWRVEPVTMGEIDATGLFTSSGRAGEATVWARDGNDEAMAAITVQQFEDIVDPGAPDAPDRFAEAEPRGDCAPQVLYPQPLTVIPRNMVGLSFMWDGGYDAIEVVIQAGELRVRWYTDANLLTPEGDPWKQLLSTATGGNLQVTISGLRGRDRCDGLPFQILVDTAPLQGAIYYWSTGDVGIMRLPAGDREPEPFLTPQTAPEINCPACHALSRDGNHIAFTRTTFPPFGDLAISAIETPRNLNYDPAGVGGYFPSFSPDAERIAGGFGGNIVIRDTTTGMQLENLPLPEGFVANSPDWSWQGTRMVAAVGPANVNPLPDVGMNLSSIFQWTDDEGWMMPEVIAQTPENTTYDRPSFAPTGQFVAFERKGGDGGDGMGDASAALMIIDAEGGIVDMDRANQGPRLGNSWPKWAPANNQGRLWLAFSSLRDYGHQLRNEPVGEDSRPQIWVTGIDPNAPPGTDPSSPAFWLPGQNLQSGNHIPYWAAYEKE
jgi:hypothetical protein